MVVKTEGVCICASEFKEYSAVWDAMNNRLSKSPLLEAIFVQALVDEFSNENTRLVIIGDMDKPTIMVLIEKKNIFSWETFQPSQSPIALFIADSALTFEDIRKKLFGIIPGFKLLIGITQQDPLIQYRPENTGAIKTVDYIETARIKISGVFDEYWAGVSKNLRKNTNKQRNKLKRDDIATKLEIISASDLIESSIKDYGKIESNGWKAGMGTAVNINNAQGRFYTNILRKFSKKGKGYVFRYWYGDELVATDICIASDTMLIVLKTTYDESIKDSSPAMLMRQEVFRWAFDNGVLENIEFYGQVMAWHKRVSKDIRRMYHVNLYRYSLIAKIMG